MKLKKNSLGQWDKTGYEISRHYLHGGVNMGMKKIAVQGFSASQNTRTSTSLLTRQHRPLQAFQCVEHPAHVELITAAADRLTVRMCVISCIMRLLLLFFFSKMRLCIISFHAILFTHVSI